MKQLLNENWKLCYFEDGEGEKYQPWTIQYADDEWLDARVPGEVHLDLLWYGNIEEPFSGKNDLKCHWVAEKEWWFRKKFLLPSTFRRNFLDKLELVFQGLDTFASVWLNGNKIGDHANMFAPWILDVTGNINWEEENLLVVRLRSPFKVLDPQIDTRKYWAAFYPGRIFARKCQCTFGWDWGPELPNIGIWRPVELHGYRTVKILDLWAKTINLQSGRARIEVEVELEELITKSNPCSLEIELMREKQKITQKRSFTPVKGVQKMSFFLEVENPALWWPNGAGEPNLYLLEARVKEENSSAIARYSQKIGIRTMALEEELDLEEEGKTFTFLFNGEKIFARGANWIPADAFLPRISRARYRQLLEQAKMANMNILRVWGGGIYEDPYFYDLCDKLGIMIWQDFMYACADYPGDNSQFVNEARREAEIVVRQLRNHPCILVWCGNNENQWIHRMKEKSDPSTGPYQATNIFFEVIPEVLHRMDPTRPYRPSSPWGGEEPDSPLEGNRHSYEVWVGINVEDESLKGVGFHNYAREKAKFLTEYGIQSPPALETLKTVISEKELWPLGDTVAYHNKHPKGMQRIQTYNEGYFGVPQNIEEYIRFGQLGQAEGLKFAIEHFRRLKFHCSGSLFWQFNDCWPVISWSILDYYLRPKIAFYYVKRAYQPLLISFREEEGKISLWVTSDLLKEVKGKIEVWQGNFQRNVFWHREIELSVSANKSFPLDIPEFSQLTIKEKNQEYLGARFIPADYSLSDMRITNQFFFVPFRELKFLPANLKAKTEREGEDVRLKISTDNYLRLLEISADTPEVFYSDNYFDLFPGDEVKIVISGRMRKIFLRGENAATIELAV